MYKVILSAHGNPDHYENPYKEIVDSNVSSAESIEECQRIVRQYIVDNDLGGGNWTGGDVFLNGEKVGYISYNGRYWEGGIK